MSTYDQASRALSGALEPFVGSVYFARECHEAYEALGFAPSSRTMNGVMLPDGPAYFTSRGSLMGQVPGEVVAAAFAVFNPTAVIPSVAFGWSIADAQTMRSTRATATVTQLKRILGDHPDGVLAVREALAKAIEACHPAGRPLFAGAVSGEVPVDDLAAAWHLGDCLREFRGDSHTAAWIGAGFDSVEIGLLTERFWGLPQKSYVRTRAWTDEQLDAGIERLRTRGLLTADGLTTKGQTERDAIETATDAQMHRPLAAIGDQLEPVVAILKEWSMAVQAAHGYPNSGPMDLANAIARA